MKTLEQASGMVAGLAKAFPGKTATIKKDAEQNISGVSVTAQMLDTAQTREVVRLAHENGWEVEIKRSGTGVSLFFN